MTKVIIPTSQAFTLLLNAAEKCRNLQNLYLNEENEDECALILVEAMQAEKELDNVIYNVKQAELI
jgi:hypothetical protein